MTRCCFNHRGRSRAERTKAEQPERPDQEKLRQQKKNRLMGEVLGADRTERKKRLKLIRGDEPKKKATVPESTVRDVEKRIAESQARASALSPA